MILFNRVVKIIFIMTFIFLIFLPLFSFAQGPGPSFICTKIIPQTPKERGGRPPGTVDCQEQSPCGPVPGKCMHEGLGCKAITPPTCAGNEGKLDPALEGLKGLLDQVMKALMGGMGGGGGGGMPPPMPTGSMPPQQPNVLDQITPSTSDSLKDAISEETDGGTRGILDSVFGIFGDDEEEGTTVATTSTGSVTNITDGIGSSGSSVSDSTDASGGTIGGASGDGSGGVGVQISDDETSLLSGDRSGVTASDNEATFEAGVRDEEGNTEVSGFYGFTTRAIGQISVVERLCTSRPWAGSFVSRIIPETFFDGLCIRRGFDVSASAVEEPGVQAPANITEVENQVKARIEERERPDVEAGEAGILCEPETARPGDDINLSFSCGTAELTGTSGFTVLEASEVSAVVSAVDTSQYAIACSDKKTYSCIVQVFDPRVSIWADPENVPLGTRTKVFWTTEDVDNCVIKGPSFSETGPFGGASTVPINGLSEYKITCIAPDGAEITETTTVDLSI